MIIRATRKVLNLSGIKPEKNEIEITDFLPGEWYVDTISLGKPGKMGLQFLHHPTRISVIVPGKSLNKVYDNFKIRVSEFLNRHGYKSLIEKFELDSELEIFSTNDKGMIAHMNQIKRNTEYHCAKSKDVNKINYNWIEDIYLEYPFTTKKTGAKYINTKKLLEINSIQK